MVQLEKWRLSTSMTYARNMWGGRSAGKTFHKRPLSVVG